MNDDLKTPRGKIDYALMLVITIVLIIFVVILIISYFFPYLLRKQDTITTSPEVSSTISTIIPSETATQSIQTSASAVPTQTSNKKTYTDNSWGFSIEYPENYQTVNDTYGWPHVLVHLMPQSGGQSYEGQIEWWDTATGFHDTYKTDPKYIVAHPNGKNWITINYYSDPNNIWQSVIDSFKFK